MTEEKPKVVQLRPEIKEFAGRMERRMRGAAKKVAAGEIPHLKFMSLADLVKAFERNAVRVVKAATDPVGHPPSGNILLPDDAADAANYLRLIAERLAEGSD